jgi:DNA polymerase III delta prime subunit
LKGGTRKCAIFSEADGISKVAQKALRVPMEKYAEYIVTLITANYSSKIIDALHSRGCTIKLHLASKKDLRTFAKRVIDGEKLKINDDQLEDIIKEARGKFRNVVNILQGYSAGGKCYYKSKKDLDDKIKESFRLLKQLKLDDMFEKFEEMMEEFDETTIILRLAETIKVSDMPMNLKARCIMLCEKCMVNTQQGSDPYLSFWALCSELIIVLSVLQSKNSNKNGVSSKTKSRKTTKNV